MDFEVQREEFSYWASERRLSKTAIRIYAVLLEFREMYGRRRIIVSQRRILEAANIKSKSTIGAALDRLATEGFISIYHHPAPNVPDSYEITDFWKKRFIPSKDMYMNKYRKNRVCKGRK